MLPFIPSPIILPAVADFHGHLRDGALAAAVVPTIRQGGVNTVYCMPNLDPPLTTVASALAYRERLLALGGAGGPVNYLMTLYLHPDITPQVVRDAAAAGIAGIKAYPQGVTTNSASGVASLEPSYPVFAAMEEHGLVLNLHGEERSGGDVTVLNAEARFLPTLRTLHERFPRLRIVLEHCTTADAVRAVRECGATVAGTITAHHLCLTVDDWAGDVHCFCKPVAKTPDDRRALLRAAVGGGGKFFLGTDSAPHPVQAKEGPGRTAAGVFTQPHAAAYVMTALDEGVARGDVNAEDVTQEALEGFLGRHGRAFYGLGLEDAWVGERIRLSRGRGRVADKITGPDGVEVVPFRSGSETWGVQWLPEGDDDEVLAD